MTKILQQARHLHTFRCGHRYRLPRRGQSTQHVQWNYDTHCWLCKHCKKAIRQARQRGHGPEKMLGAVSARVLGVNACSRAQGYAVVQASNKTMLAAWVKQGGSASNPKQIAKCAITGRPLSWAKADMAHNHRTGEFLGWWSRGVNIIEGILAQMSRSELISFNQKVLQPLLEEFK